MSHRAGCSFFRISVLFVLAIGVLSAVGQPTQVSAVQATVTATVTATVAATVAATATSAVPLVTTPSGTALAAASGASAGLGLARDEQEVMFKSGDDTLFGTLLIPANATGKMPAVLLLSGSGPTDRDGNSPLIPGKVDSHKNFARALADAGVASLRYDKLGSGKTGIGSFASHVNDVGFNLYVQEAISGYDFLKARPEVDPARMAILGHSEGGLITLVVADQLKATNEPKALILAAPLSTPYLTTLREQIAAQYDAAVKDGKIAQTSADASLAELDNIITMLLSTGKLPDKVNPPFDTIFNAANAKFLAEAGKYDPVKLAAGLPATLSVLILCGEKDIQVKCSDVQHVADGFIQAGDKNVSFHQLANVIHVFKEVEGTLNPNPLLDYADPQKPFSKEAVQLLTDFVKANL